MRTTGRWSPLFACVVAVALALFTLEACTSLPPRSLRASEAERVDAATTPVPRPSTTGFVAANATPQQRAETVDRIWRTIGERYYDPDYNGADLAALRARTLADVDDVSSDAAFYRALKRDVRAMKDSHTLVLTPREAEDSRTKRATQMGLVFALVDDRVLVASVVPDFPAAVAGVKPGMIIEAVDDVSLDRAFFAQALAQPAEPLVVENASASADDLQRSVKLRAVRNLLVAQTGEPHAHRLRLRLPDDAQREVELRAQSGDVSTRVSYRVLPSRVGVLHFTRFDWAARDELARAIDEARRETRALVVDLRSNPGGEQRLFTWLVARFSDRPVEVGQSVQRTKDGRTIEPIRAGGTRDAYMKPIAVLIDQSTGSAAELTAHALVELRAAIAVGEPTCGCVVAVRWDYELPDGGALRVSERGFRSARGRRMEADPLQPTIRVEPTLDERRRGDDAVLRVAEHALLSIVAPVATVAAPGTSETIDDSVPAAALK